MFSKNKYLYDANIHKIFKKKKWKAVKLGKIRQ